VKPVTKNRVYEKNIVDQLLKLIMSFCGAHKCHVRGHKTPLQDSGPKMQTGYEFARNIVQMASFMNPLFYVWLFLDQLRKDTVFSS
jgi:hypothetical protein